MRHKTADNLGAVQKYVTLGRVGGVWENMTVFGAKRIWDIVIKHVLLNFLLGYILTEDNANVQQV